MAGGAGAGGGGHSMSVVEDCKCDSKNRSNVMVLN